MTDRERPAASLLAHCELGLHMLILLGLVFAMLYTVTMFVAHAAAGQPWLCVRDFAGVVICFVLMRWALV